MYKKFYTGEIIDKDDDNDINNNNNIKRGNEVYKQKALENYKNALLYTTDHKERHDIQSKMQYWD